MKKILKYGLITIGTLWVGLVIASIISAIIGPSVPDDSILRVTFDGDLSDASSDDLASTLTGEPQVTLHDVTFGIRAAAEDPKILGLVLDVHSPQLSMAQVQDIAAAMEDYRQSGKWSVSFLETAGEFSRGDGNYALAICADEVILAPPGEVNLLGLSITVPFIRGALDKLRIHPFVEKRHDYKNAANTFTETKFTGAHQEATKNLVEDLQVEHMAHIAARRSITPEIVQGWFAKGTHSAQEALDAKMVDTLAYWDAVEERIKQIAKRDDPWIDLGRYQKIRKQSETEHTMAMILGEGQIVRDRDSGLSSDAMASGTITQAFRDARRDGVKGVLFRINSPGGSYIASDLIRREVELTRQAGIPVVVSMGSLAASGGYFVAMEADKIVAQPSTLTGSIGVFAGRFAMRDFFAQIGVTFDSYKASTGGGTFDWLDPPNEESKIMMAAALDRIYDDFVTKAAKGRALSKEALHAVAQGRVWSGKAALEHKLVDALGGTKVAALELKKLANLNPQETVAFAIYPKPKTPIEMLRDLLEGSVSINAALIEALSILRQPNTAQALYSPSPTILY